MPLYEYRCDGGHLTEVFVRRIPTDMDLYRTRPCGADGCGEVATLTPPLAVCGDAVVKTELKLSRERRRYHQRAPEREAARRTDDPGREASVDADGVIRVKRTRPITRDELREEHARRRKSKGRE